MVMAASLSLRAEEAEGGFDMNKYIFGHIEDAYCWHITEFMGKEITIPLPCIVFGKQHEPAVFMSTRLEEGAHYKGYYIAPDGSKYAGKLVEESDQGEIRPFDISITKDVVALFVSAVLLVWLVLACSRWYYKHDVLKEAPTGIAAVLEPVILMIEDDVIKDGIGEGYQKYSPYLLTAFFFILINNLLGIIPIFPGGANVTGNIAITMVLALFSFVAISGFANKYYWKDIFWPDVPLFLKAFPLMPMIEFVGVFTKPFALMIRLFANMMAGHILILCVIAMIFIGVAMGPVITGAFSVVAVLFGVFMDLLELLVAFIQAYVFTMLTAVFIGLAHPKPENE